MESPEMRSSAHRGRAAAGAHAQPQSGGTSPASAARMRGSRHGEATKGTRRASGGRHERTEGPVRQWVDRPWAREQGPRDRARATTGPPRHRDHLAGRASGLQGAPRRRRASGARVRAVGRGQLHRGALHARGTAEPRALRVPITAIVGPEHAFVPGGGPRLRCRHRRGQRGMGGRHPPGGGCYCPCRFPSS